MLVANQLGHKVSGAGGSTCGSHMKPLNKDYRKEEEKKKEEKKGEKQEKQSVNEDEVPDNKLGELIRKLKVILSGKGLASEDVDIERVKQVMEEYESNEEEWGKYALHDQSRPYTRNGVVDINGNANLLILVWSPKRASAIHDHANAHCCMKILKGSLQESLYDIPKEEGHHLDPKKETVMHRGEVGYISDSIGLHKISNPLPDQYSVSLHLYTPPYASMYGCSMYEANNGRKHHVDMSKYYSWQGKLVNTKNSSLC